MLFCVLLDAHTYCLSPYIYVYRCCGRREKHHHDRSPSATEAGMPEDVDYVSEEEEEREVEMMPQKGRKGAKKAAPAV